MKKFFLIVAAISLTMLSCKKQYDCVCTSSGNGVSVSSTTSFRDTEKNAKAACDQQGKNTNAGTGSTTTCTLN